MRIYVAGVVALLSLTLAGCPQKQEKAGEQAAPAAETSAAPAAPMETAPAADAAAAGTTTEQPAATGAAQ